MRRLKLLLSIVLAAWIGLAAAAPAADLSTPEGAVAAYIEGVARQDFDAVIAATSVDKMSKGFDFVAQIERLRILSLVAASAPADDLFFVAVNKANFQARIAGQVQFLAFGLLTTSEVLDGKSVRMDAAEAAEFASAFRASRLADLALVKVGTPNPKALNGKTYQAIAAKAARVYSADDSTERVALVSFEGNRFAIGFSLLRYGDEWTVMSQTSPVSGIGGLGAPKRMTMEAFEAMIK